jgi:hypothetical protein
MRTVLIFATTVYGQEQAQQQRASQHQRKETLLSAMRTVLM